MAIVVEGGSRAFDALFYPQQSYNNVGVIESQLSNVYNTLNEQGRAFLDRSREVVGNMFNITEMNNLVRRLGQTVKGFFEDTNRIAPIDTLEDLQLASVMMQRWVMAQPTLRQAYLDQRVDGYNDTYVNVFGETTKEDHYDYRRVMNGVVVDEGDHLASLYFEELYSNDRELTHDEQRYILSTWDVIECFMSQDIDPTNAFE